jgi:AcrR family transcriptional regulator
MSENEMARASTTRPKPRGPRAVHRSVRRENGGRDFALDIVNAAWELVQEGEILDFTVRQVTDRAQVALKTFYRYFGNKDELLLAMLEQSMREFADRFLEFASSDPVERLRYLVTTPIVMDFDDQSQRVTRWRGRERQRLLASFPDAVEAVYEPYRAAIAQAIIDVCDAGAGSCDAPDMDATLLLHLVREMAHGVHGGGIDDQPELVAERVWHMAWSALAGVAPAARRSVGRM